MTTQILEFSGLALGGLAIIISFIAIFFSGKARSWNKYFRNEEQPQNLEDIIDKMTAKLKNLETKQDEIIVELAKQGNTLNTAVQHVGLVRYDSGADDGGNLSFSAAFLDAHQSGLVITSLHGRQHNRVYSKLIREGGSEHTLSEEEKEAVIQALTYYKK